MSISKDNIKSEAFIGRGEVHFTPVIGGVEQETFWVGVASEQKIEHSVSDKKKLYEYHNKEQVLWDASKGKTEITMSIKLDERRKEPMKAALKAGVKVIPEITITDEEYTPPGKLFFLNHTKLENLTAIDGAGQPLAEGADFEVDLVYGQVKLLKDNLTMPLKFSFESGQTEKMVPMTENIDHIIVRTKGFNTVGDEGEHLVTVYKFNMDVASTLDLLSDDFTSTTITGECLYSESMKGTYDIEKLN